MGKNIQALAAVAGILGLVIAILALVRDTLDFTISRSSEQSQTSLLVSQGGRISKSGVAIVFNPPSNIRESPNGEILCSVQKQTTINIYGSTGPWYYTDICGSMGVIHSSQVTF